MQNPHEVANQFSFNIDATNDNSVKKTVVKAINKWSSSKKVKAIKKLGKQVEIKKIIVNDHCIVTAFNQEEKRYLLQKRRAHKKEKIKKEPLGHSQIDGWSYTMKVPKDFENKKDQLEIKETYHLVDCQACHTSGTETCPTCNGQKQKTCGTCNGGGRSTCGSCGGRGRVTYTAYEENMVMENYHDTTYDSQGRGTTVTKQRYVNRPKAVTKEKACGTCGGSGQSRCGTCGGRGIVLCGTCNGSGRITCRTCEGKTKVLQFSCIEQEFSINRKQSVIKNKQLFDTYPGFYELAAKADKKLIYELKDREIPLNIDFGAEKINQAYQNSITKLNASAKDVMVHFQRVSVQRIPVCKVTYVYHEKEYDLLVYGYNNLVYAVESPLKDAAANFIRIADKLGKLRFAKAFKLYKSAQKLDEGRVFTNEINQKLKPLIQKANKFISHGVLSSLMVWAYLLSVYAISSQNNIKLWFKINFNLTDSPDIEHIQFLSIPVLLVAFIIPLYRNLSKKLLAKASKFGSSILGRFVRGFATGSVSIFILFFVLVALRKTEVLIIFDIVLANIIRMLELLPFIDWAELPGLFL